ncbi:hypothetical protein L1F06_020540 [Ectopseudomonas hydrolytica]|uniref:Uncharacterized protein n=2 Tax=Ectopseudomonas TaxID=3236654 RepID=A0ABY5A636_9GAMM|nr:MULTISPECIES: hypothetical protein [Pseudomonas]MDH0095137.1 hypothetical protein [Pseudomonas sp. GD04158]USR39032.1 hypothetical protein L1F06_020540 [Pseudomonas hydrolytica]
MSDLGLANSVWQRFQGVNKMKLETARGLFLGLALSVTAIAAAAWQEPGPRVVDGHDCKTEQHCPNAPLRKQIQPAVKPDANLLLLMFGLSGAMKGEQ